MTGKGGDVRLVQSKKKTGLCFNELICLLPNGLSFLIDVSVTDCNETTDKALANESVLSHWLEIVKRHDRANAPPTVIAFDSNFMDTATEQLFLNNSIPFIGNVKEKSFKDIHDLVAPHVKKAGDWCGAYCEATNELYVYHWSSDINEEKKCVLTNCLLPRNEKIENRRYIIPACDEYNIMFSLSDEFHENLENTCWPFRIGGHEAFSKLRIEHNFVFSVILQNVFSLYLCMNNIKDDVDLKYSTLCGDLALQLFTYATRE
jgi:hypothetical protein